VIAQLVGEKELGLQLQLQALSLRAIYRSPCRSDKPQLRVLAIAAAADIGGNTPLEFLLEGNDIELYTYYVVPGFERPEVLPDHDVAFIAIPESDTTHETLGTVQAMLLNWPRPVINNPRSIAELERDRLHKLLEHAPGIDIPATARVDRDDIADVVDGEMALDDILSDGAFPLIIRPVGSQAGHGLAKLDSMDDVMPYLEAHESEDFFLSRFVDYSGDDGQFRKYRVVFVAGKAFACHLAIAGQWDLWYANAEMEQDDIKRSEEKRFMEKFDEEFAARHAKAFAELTHRVGLDYFAIDCAETKDGKLLIFEADIAMIVHNMDPSEVYPYKGPQMQKIFAAFAALLEARAGKSDSQAEAA
jgi:glutathione synthase/RimK-type ligase-like ATP-grasp enzyme